MMPQLSGFEVTTHIRENLASKIPILIISALSDKESISKALCLGVNAYITKPINIQEMMTTIRRYLHE